jgi:hypothetical protein
LLDPLPYGVLVDLAATGDFRDGIGEMNLHETRVWQAASHRRLPRHLTASAAVARGVARLAAIWRSSQS